MMYNVMYNWRILMPRMVRKQIYIEELHDRQLRRIAESRGISQAEVVRQAIDSQARGEGETGIVDPGAWQQAMAFMHSLQVIGVTERAPQRWQRDELYSERLKRHDRSSD
jgi:pyrroloquinoline quinone (PQQ) biosynthesis protein C